MNTFYDEKEILANDEGWLFYDAAFKCWKAIHQNLVGQTALDIGCASGVMIALSRIFNPSIHIEGFEGSDSAKPLWDKRGINVSVGNIYNIPFSDKLFDTVYTSHVVEHCYLPENIISESIRLAKKRIIHIVPEGNVDDKNFGSPHIQKFNRKSFLQLFDRPELEKVRYESILDGHMNSFLAVYDVK